MSVTLRIHLSSTVEIEVSGDDHRQAIEQAAFWTNLPTECPVCGSPLVLFYRTPQQYEFYGLRCTGNPAHESTFGIHKADGSLFYKEREPWKDARAPQTDEDGWPEADEAAYGDSLPPQRPEPPRQQRGNAGGNGRNGTALKPVGQQARQAAPTPEAGGSAPVCDVCGKGLTLGQINYSTNKFGVPLCPAHQS